MPITPLQYYGDEANYGSYQWVPLDDIITGLMADAEMDDDHYLKNMRRSAYLSLAKRAIREVTRSTATQRSSFAVTIPTHLTWPLPQDFVSYSSISLVELDTTTGSYRLRPLSINPNINTALDNLQDDNFELLFDDAGQILTGDVVNAIGTPYQRFQYQRGQYNDASQLSANGEFNIDEDRGIIAFSSDLSEQTVVIKYMSDGLQAGLSESEIKVHKDLRVCIEDYIFWKAIARKKNAGRGDKIDAKNAFYTSRHKAVLAAAKINLLEIARSLRANPIP